MKKKLKDHPILLSLGIVGLLVLIYIVIVIIYKNAWFDIIFVAFVGAITIANAIIWLINHEKIKQPEPPISVDYKIVKCMEKVFKELCKKYGKKNKNILIVGDVMLDHKMEIGKAEYKETHSHGLGEDKVNKVKKVSDTLGGAAHVAEAFYEVSSDITLIGVIGSDCEGNALKKTCGEYKNINFKPIEAPESSNVLTTTKIYHHYLIGGQKKPADVRFDRENKELTANYCNRKDIQDQIIKNINEVINKIHCIVIKDHEKGMISKKLVEEISKIADKNNKPLFVDPKYDWEKFNDAKIAAILPNIKEAASGYYDIYNDTDIDRIRAIENACELKNDVHEALVKKYSNCDYFIIKKAEKGAVILSRDANNWKKEDIKPLKLGDDFVDDIGCGDVFDAFAIIGMLNEPTPEELRNQILEDLHEPTQEELHKHMLEELHKNRLKAVLFANFVAGLSAKKTLGEHVSLTEIENELKQDSFEHYIIDNLKVVNKI